MATLSDLQEAGPAGDFYAWVLKRYQRVIVRLVILLIVVVVGSTATSLWFASRLTALEQRTPVPAPVVEGPTTEQWRQSLAQQAQRNAALERRLNKTTGCLNQNFVALNKALQELVTGRLRASDFVSDFKLRACR